MPHDSLTIAEAAARVRAGELVAFPTETVYGLGANALDAAAVAKIYALKGRPAASPLIVHASSIEMARTLVTAWPDEAQALAERYWPGPLTLVLPKAASIPDIVTAGLATVGVRVPDHPMAIELIEEAGVPIAAPSANRFTGLSPTTAQHVRDAFGEAAPVLDGGPCEVGIESTVVQIAEGKITLLRPGRIAAREIAKATMTAFDDLEGAENASLSRDVPHLSLAGPHPAPGMHERHYSPRTRLLLVDDPAQLPDKLGAYVWIKKSGAAARSVRMPADPAAYAARLYSVLHELDQERWPWIAVEAPPESGSAWEGVRDRLRRAAHR